MTKVSVIMPVFNAGEFLKAAVDSILNQSLSDIELICVDDGSTDGSLDVLQEYANADNRVTVFCLDHNGAGNARNFALSHTSGEYLYFMDADDILDSNAFEDFCSICESKDLDFLFFKLINYDVVEDRYFESDYYNMPRLSSFVGDKVFNADDLGDLVFSTNSSTCSKFYNRDFVIKSGARFRENSKFNDNQFFWDVIFSAERIYFLDEFYYTRTRHSASLTGAGDKNHIDIIGVVNDIYDLFIKHGQFEKHKKLLYNRKISWFLPRYEEIDDSFKELFYVEMKKDFKRYEGTDFADYLSSDKRFIYDSVLVSQNHVDFDKLKEFYSIIHGKLSPDDEVSAIKNWFDSLNNDYKSHFFDSVKFRLKKLKNKELSSRNAKFCNDIITSSSISEYRNIKVSVIMPVYNAGEFLKGAVDSILNQSLSDIELICVDDGSTDGSLDVLQEYANADDRVTVFCLDHNGAGNARNFALSHTSGEYLYFMDADDILDLNAFEDFCSICESKDLDFLFFKLVNYDVAEDRYFESDYYNMPRLSSFVGDKVFNADDLGDLVFSVSSSTCSKFYNRDFVIKSGARFRENSKFNDNQFFWDVIFSAERIYFLDEFYYTRTRHSASLTGAGDKKHIDIIGVVNDIYDLFIKHGQFEKYKKALYNRKISWFLPRYEEIDDSFKELFYVEMKKDFKRYEGTDFADYLSSDKRFIYDSVLVSQNHVDFDKLKEFYSIIHGKLSPDDEVSAIKNWFVSLDEEYKSYFFDSVKFRLKRLKNKELSVENEIFLEEILNYYGYIDYSNQSLVSNFESLLNDLSEIGDGLDQEEGSEIRIIHDKINAEFKSLFDQYRSSSNELNDCKSDINNKDNIISNLNDEVNVYKSEIAEKDALISDMKSDIGNYVSVIHENNIAMSRLQSKNSYLTKQNKFLTEKNKMWLKDRVKNLFFKFR